LPFEIKENEAQIYASVYEYTGIANLGLKIIKDNNNEKV
jgi:hypothetical protein